MPYYKFAAFVIIEADSEAEAKIRVGDSADNISEMTGHAPYTCNVEIDAEDFEEVEDEDDFYEDDE